MIASAVLGLCFRSRQRLESHASFSASFEPWREGEALTRPRADYGTAEKKIKRVSLKSGKRVKTPVPKLISSAKFHPTAPTVIHVAFCAKAVRVCAWLAAFYTKAPAVAVMDNCDTQGETSLIVVAHIATAANTANEIAADVATPWTLHIGSHRRPPLRPARGCGHAQLASHPLHALLTLTLGCCRVA
jgi:hypothetical protein